MASERSTTYDAKVWTTEKYAGSRVTTYRVMWKVDTRRWKRPFRTAAQAESFRAKLLAAVRDGQAFDIETGLPVAMARKAMTSLTWYDFACQYVDAKWPLTSPNHRMGTANVLMSVTTALMADAMPPDEEAARDIRSALINWAFNARRGSQEQPVGASECLAWVVRNSPSLTVLTDPRVVRAVLTALTINLDGTRAAGRTATWRRSVFSTAINHAVEMQLLESNPVPAAKWTASKSLELVDRRAVVNPTQARALLQTVAETPRSGQRLAPFFATMYYSALRPEEAVNLRRANLELPAAGWGWITLEHASPEVSRQWSNSDKRREVRELKHRAVGETRRVPCPPALTATLRQHLAEYGADEQGRLFSGERGDPLSHVTYIRLWRRAREAAFTPAQVDSPLARRPYDLRHAAVSTWLNSGVAPTQVAEWAGHSVAVLLRIYAKCIDGQEAVAFGRIDQALER